MQDPVKIWAATAVGYALGRTRKAKAAIGVALWLTGRPAPRDLLQHQVVKLLETPDVQELIDQLRESGTLATQAGLAALESAAARVADRDAGLSGGEPPEDGRDGKAANERRGLGHRRESGRGGHRCAPAERVEQTPDLDADALIAEVEKVEEARAIPLGAAQRADGAASSAGRAARLNAH